MHAGTPSPVLATEGATSGLKEVHCDDATFAAACNEGIRAAAGELIAFIFAGWYPGPTWLSRLLEPFDDDEVAVSGGPVLEHDGVTVQDACWVTDSFGRRSASRTIPFPDYWSSPFSDTFVCPIAGNSIFRRSRLLEIGGYDERYEEHLAHVDVCRRLLDRGWVVRPVVDAPVFQSSRTTARAHRWSSRREGRSPVRDDPRPASALVCRCGSGRLGLHHRRARGQRRAEQLRPRFRAVATIAGEASA